NVRTVEWLTVVDARVDPDCEALHEEQWPIDSIPNEPPLHPRCRCWLSPVVDGQPLTQPEKVKAIGIQTDPAEES
ncbi:hypothetical protein LCGC14_3012710, partial [marine sediment metagenome]